jgi:2-haloacid dehalogenase
MKSAQHAPARQLDFNRFEVLTFDCYGTLINWEDGILGALRPIFAAHGKQIDDATALKFYGDFEAAAEKGEYRPYRQVLETVVRNFGERLGFNPTGEEVSSLPNSLAHWRPWPDTVKTLQKLKRRFRLCIISNVDDDLFAATAPRLEVKFDHVITAQQAKAYKPARRIFELALNRVGVSADRILHVGQSIYHDVIPAQSLGLATVWVNRPSARAGVGAVVSAQGNPDLQVSSLGELADAARGLKEF